MKFTIVQVPGIIPGSRTGTVDYRLYRSTRALAVLLSIRYVNTTTLPMFSSLILVGYNRLYSNVDLLIIF